jgi:hypothetical protein
MTNRSINIDNTTKKRKKIKEANIAIATTTTCRTPHSLMMKRSCYPKEVSFTSKVQLCRNQSKTTSPRCHLTPENWRARSKNASRNRSCRYFTNLSVSRNRKIKSVSGRTSASASPRNPPKLMRATSPASTILTLSVREKILSRLSNLQASWVIMATTPIWSSRETVNLEIREMECRFRWIGPWS